MNLLCFSHCDRTLAAVHKLRCVLLTLMMQFHPMAQLPMQAAMPAPAGASPQPWPTATFGAPPPVYHPAAPWTHGHAPTATMQQPLQLQHQPIQQPQFQPTHFQPQQTCPPFYATNPATPIYNVTQQPTHNMMPQLAQQQQYPPFPTPPQHSFDTTTFPTPASTAPAHPFVAPPQSPLQSAPIPVQHGTQPPFTQPGMTIQQAHNPPAAIPQPILPPPPVPIQHGGQPPLAQPATAPQHTSNPPVTHSPNPTTVTSQTNNPPATYHPNAASPTGRPSQQSPGDAQHLPCKSHWSGSTLQLHHTTTPTTTTTPITRLSSKP